MKKYIIIPTLEPDPCFLARVEELREQIPAQIVVIDDGSGSDYRERFEQIDEMDGCVVLYHEENRGKGRALKTGFSYVRRCLSAEKKASGGSGEWLEPAAGILCLDSDGQHSAENGAELLELVENCPGTLILGGRDFTGREVPWKSRLGNRVSSAVFRLISGRYLSDTQTGLRAFDDSLLDLMTETPGERFEYETNVLLACISRGICIRTEKISTVYIDKNKGTHFRPVRDSAAILRTLFRELFRFGVSSLLCAFLDLFLFWLFDRGKWPAGWQERAWHIAAATAGARLLSASLNFILNRYWVFGRGKGWVSLRRYLLLCIGIAAASAASVWAVSALFGADPTAVKIFCDALLFLMSWRIQRSRVFPGRRKGGKSHAG